MLFNKFIQILYKIIMFFYFFDSIYLMLFNIIINFFKILLKKFIPEFAFFYSFEYNFI
jgi:hypothetical protein